MYQSLSDQSITKQMNKAFQNNIDQKIQSISDTNVIQTNQGRVIAYFAKTKLKQLILVLINVDAQQSKAIKILKVQSKTQLPVQKLSIQMKKCPYDDDIYALIITDLAKPKGRNKSIFFASISTVEIDQQKSVQLACSYAQRQQQIKDLVWHPYSPFTFMILLESKIQVYNAQKSVYEPQSQFIIQDLKVKNSGQRITKGSIQKFGFCEDFNQQNNISNQRNNLSSFGKKISLFLINSKGNIFMLFPFLVKKIILDKDQQSEVSRLTKDPQTKRQIQIGKSLKTSTIFFIQSQSQQSQQKVQYFLQFKALPRISQSQAFKLNNLNSNNHHLQTKVMINSFSISTLAKTTIFVYSTRKKQNQSSLFIDAFSQNPYRKMLSENKYDKSQNFNCQRINEIKFGKISEEYGSFKIFVDQFENILYAYVNRKACFKISLDGFVKIINATNKELQLYDIKLVEMDVLFNSKTSFSSLAYFQSMIYLVKYNKSYSFTSVPLQSLQLKEKIRQTNEQTQKLFEKLAKTNQKQKQKLPISQPVEMKQLSETNLSQIQKKLQSFSSDYKKSVQKKIQSIKTLYENIQQKTSSLQQHDKLKNQIVQNLNKAQQNDQKIKQIINKEKKDKSQIQKQFLRRLQSSAKLLEELQSKIADDFRNKSPEQQQILNDCEEQADGIIQCLELLKEKLLKKKFQLQREFGAPLSVRLQKESYIYK